MQELSQNPIIREPSQVPWIASITIFIVTTVVILGLWGYQFITAAHIETLQTEIRTLDADIGLASNDRNIVVANILASTNIRPSIDLKSLVRSFRLAATQARVRLNGFSVKDDIISSTLVATRDTDGIDPVEIIVEMMRSKVLAGGLSLAPIHSLQGTSNERTTAVSFKILPTNAITNVTK